MVFREMPQKDTVSWNTLISGYISWGFTDTALDIFLEMQEYNIRPNEFTYSMLLQCVNCDNHAKEIHSSAMRLGYLNLVLSNSLIDVYGNLGLLPYSHAVFFSMVKVDVISWNSLISGCCSSENYQLALHNFFLMRSSGFKMDEHTMSAVLSACSKLRNLEKGKHLFCLCVKLGFLCNTLVCSAAIDFFSKCNRMGSAICVFEESRIVDSAICNSMIACYVRHNMEENAMEFFVSSFRGNVRPTEFTLSCVLHSASEFVATEHGSHLHSLVIKLGFESDAVVASSLVQMYGKYGLVDSALEIFCDSGFKDLIAWNTMILSLTNNGRPSEAILLFDELLKTGLSPDHITFSAVLLACNYGGFLQRGMAILSSMQEQHRIDPLNDHYYCIVETMIRARKIKAVSYLKSVDLDCNGLLLESLLGVCMDYRDLCLIEKVAEKWIEIKPESSFPYMALVYAYGERCKWESVVRVRKEMRKMVAEEDGDCSWIGIRGHVFSFEADKIMNRGLKNVHAVLGLLLLEKMDEDLQFLGD